MKIWKDFKDYVRKNKIFKSGDGAKKGLDPKQAQLMEKMNGFETEVPDLFSNTISSLTRGNKISSEKSKSIWQSTGDVISNPRRKRKCPPASRNYLDREDKKNQLFEMMLDFKDKVDDLTENSKKLIASKTQASQVSLSPQDQARNNLRVSLENIIGPYFVNLDSDKRARCFEEMLQVIE